MHTQTLDRGRTLEFMLFNYPDEGISLHHPRLSPFKFSLPEDH